MRQLLEDPDGTPVTFINLGEGYALDSQTRDTLVVMLTDSPKPFCPHCLSFDVETLATPIHPIKPQRYRNAVEVVCNVCHNNAVVVEMDLSQVPMLKSDFLQ